MNNQNNQGGAVEIGEAIDLGVAKERGFWLSAFLILMFIANPFTAVTYFSKPDMIIQA